MGRKRKQEQSQAATEAGYAYNQTPSGVDPRAIHTKTPHVSIHPDLQNKTVQFGDYVRSSVKRVRDCLRLLHSLQVECDALKDQIPTLDKIGFARKGCTAIEALSAFETTLHTLLSRTKQVPYRLKNAQGAIRDYPRDKPSGPQGKLDQVRQDLRSQTQPLPLDTVLPAGLSRGD